MPHKDPLKKQEYNRNYRLRNKENIKRKRKEWELKNKNKLKEYHREYHKNWYRLNKIKRQKQIREYSKNHKEDNRKRSQKYVRNNKPKICAYNKKYNKTIEGFYRMYRSSAKKRNLIFNLTLNTFSEIVSQPCYYCGETQERRGIDRIDNSCGYILKNCRSACKTCNYMKRTLDDREFRGHISKIFKHLKL